jgi:hypothetical protein
MCFFAHSYQALDTTSTKLGYDPMAVGAGEEATGLPNNAIPMQITDGDSSTTQITTLRKAVQTPDRPSSSSSLLSLPTVPEGGHNQQADGGSSSSSGALVVVATGGEGVDNTDEDVEDSVNNASESESEEGESGSSEDEAGNRTAKKRKSGKTGSKTQPSRRRSSSGLSLASVVMAKSKASALRQANRANAERKLHLATERFKQKDSLGGGLTHTAALQSEMPRAVYFKVMAKDAEASGDSALALEYFEKASQELVGGARDLREPQGAFRYSGDAHLSAGRIQFRARKCLALRSWACVEVQRVFRGFLARYEQVGWLGAVQ